MKSSINPNVGTSSFMIVEFVLQIRLQRTFYQYAMIHSSKNTSGVLFRHVKSNVDNPKKTLEDLSTITNIAIHTDVLYISGRNRVKYPVRALIK